MKNLSTFKRYFVYFFCKLFILLLTIVALFSFDGKFKQNMIIFAIGFVGVLLFSFFSAMYADHFMAKMIILKIAEKDRKQIEDIVTSKTSRKLIVQEGTKTCFYAKDKLINWLINPLYINECEGSYYLHTPVCYLSKFSKFQV